MNSVKYAKIPYSVLRLNSMNPNLAKNFEETINRIVLNDRASTNDLVSLTLDLYRIIKDQDEEISRMKETLELRTGRLI